MRTDARLSRLERARQSAAAEAAAVGPSIFERVETHRAYLAGETDVRPPEPPCPPHIAPDAWEQRLLVVRCTDAWVRGELPEGEFLPGMERRARETAAAIMERTTVAAVREESASRRGWPYQTGDNNDQAEAVTEAETSNPEPGDLT